MTEDWQTPRWLFDKLNALHKFDVDAAASPKNKMVDRFWGKKRDALRQDWSSLGVWCNPPYGAGLEKWILHALIERDAARVICLLLPARTETKWWQHLTLSGGTVQFIKGRVHFTDETGHTGRPRMGSVVWTLRPEEKGLAKIGYPIAE